MRPAAKNCRLYLGLAVAQFVASPAFALHCTTPDTPKLRIMYETYIESAVLPKAEIINYKDMGTGLHMMAKIKGLMAFESCWKDSPPCKRAPQYETISIEFFTSLAELQNTYNKSSQSATIECFRKLGIATQQAKSSTFDFLR